MEDHIVTSNASTGAIDNMILTMRLNMTAFIATISVLLIITDRVASFSIANQGNRPFLPSYTHSASSNEFTAVLSRSPTILLSTPTPEDVENLSSDEKEELVGNLVADDEWNGLSMELTEIVRMAVVEDIKKNTKDFIGKDDYKVGDISKEIDERIKDQVAMFRGKEDYELGDFTASIDQISKDLTCELTGKDEYEFGDLSTEIDKRLKEKFADMCGKDEYEFGDLSKVMDRRVKERVSEFTGKEGYEFGDVANEIENRRKKWVESYLGKEAADNYEFGDVTKKALASFTGKDEYQFGDVTKKLLGGFFGKKK
mmetsp:Transcript_18197/g.22618  ORF Transcript_18197/g.22618 Transcript_18197/m.22618 type:complete len:313 (+) Transcript_18197:52-990(+)